MCECRVSSCDVRRSVTSNPVVIPAKGISQAASDFLIWKGLVQIIPWSLTMSAMVFLKSPPRVAGSSDWDCAEARGATRVAASRAVMQDFRAVATQDYRC